MLILDAAPVLTDALGYYVTSQTDPYAISWGEWAAFPYSPAALHALWPLQQLPLTVFFIGWYALNSLLLVWLVGPLWAAVLMIGPTIVDSPNPILTAMWWGNIPFLMAVAIAHMPRRPAGIAFLILTKVTPGIPVLWYAVRREWRNVAIALGVTITVGAVSFVIAPSLWAEWITMLGMAESRQLAGQLPLGPLGFRLAIAVVLVIVAARTNQAWLIAVSGFMAQPAMWPAGMVVLLAIPRLLRNQVPPRGVRIRDRNDRPHSLQRRRADY